MEWFKVKHNEFHDCPDLELVGAIHLIRCLHWQNEAPISINNLPRSIKKKHLEFIRNHPDFVQELDKIYSLSVQNQINSLHKKRENDNKDFAHLKGKQRKIESETLPNRTSRVEESRVDIYTISIEILEYLNTNTGSFFKPLACNLKYISSRLSDGYTKEQLKGVIDAKIIDQWFIQNPKYLRPETLFNATKFQTYVNEISKNNAGKDKILETMSKE